MNKVILQGNLGNDAELKILPNGSSLLKFSLATSEKWKDANGAKQERTTWHNCSYFSKGAANLVQYLTKGTKILVEGSIENREYEKDGEKRYASGVKVRDLEFCGGSSVKTEKPVVHHDGGLPPVDDFGGGLDDSEIPF